MSIPASILAVLVFADGERVTRELDVSTKTGTFREAVQARKAALSAMGAEFAPTAPYWAHLVLIDGYEVRTYGGSEAREIFGLEP